MFFMNKQGTGSFDEKLAILGSNRARRGAELKVMSAVETKSPGTFTRHLAEKFNPRDRFATDRMRLSGDDLSYALGKEGSTRKKLELASGCILNYVGDMAFLAGTLWSAGGAENSSR